VDEHFNEDLTLDDLAKHFGYSKYYFSNLFNKHFKTNLKNYVNQVRIAKAVKLLKKYSINEVSGMCGYNSLQAFFYNFKRVTGTSPKSIITSKND
jgi:two-component system response regulator YesN